MFELQLDGLLAPTHHFGSLSFGNRASMRNRGVASHPRAAAQQALNKMATVMRLGIPQAVLPPLFRPDLSFLQQCGFSGNPEAMIKQCAAEDPYLLSLAGSCAFTWTANCATVIPSTDAEDGRCHFIPANLFTTPHRSLEGQVRARMLRQIFSDDTYFCVHDPLPMSAALADEGAANHHRCVSENNEVCHVFVHSKANGMPAALRPQKFPARQSKEAQISVARLGRLRSGLSLFMTQHPKAIDSGAFHNDVVFAGTGSHILMHDSTFIDQQAVIAALEKRIPGIHLHVVSKRQLSLDEAVSSYLFNGQFLQCANTRVLLLPKQCQEKRPQRVVDQLLQSEFIHRVEFLDLSESMIGGGGPACLRLRIALNDDELAAIPQGIVLTEDKLTSLQSWVDTHFRESLSLDDLADPLLFQETQTALDALTQLLQLGSIYPFQT